MPSVFSLEGPLGRTTPQSLDFHTRTPEQTLAVLHDMIAFLKRGAASEASWLSLPVAQNAPVMVAPSNTQNPDFSKGVFKEGINMVGGVLPVHMPEAALWISKDTYELWNHALLKSGADGGLALVQAPAGFHKEVFSGSIGRAKTVLAQVQKHVDRMEQKHGSSKVNIALGVGAGLVLFAGAVVFARSRREPED